MTAALELLASQAEAIDVEPANDGAAPLGSEPKDEAPLPPSNKDALGFLLAAFREIASRVLKVESLRRTLGDAEIEQCAAVLAPVATKYGINLAGVMGGPEVIAIVTAGPILWRCYTELDAELRAKRAKPVADDEPPKDDGLRDEA